MRLARRLAIFALLPAFGVTLDARADDAVRVVDMVGPSVASVVAEPRRGEARHVGSAVVVDPDGYLLTNAHVVAGARRLVVSLPGRPPLEGHLLATAPDHDLALLRVDAAGSLPAARLARPGAVKVGQPCLAIGNALGLDSTVTRGIVSARGRRLVHEGRPLGADFIQTDATIHPGSSGGALVDLAGEVIGIIVAMEADAPGVGFAIPVARVRQVLAALSSPLTLRERWLGLEVEDAPDDGGARVVSVAPGSPAEAAGLRPGDVITSAGPIDVRTAFDLHARFLGPKPLPVRLAVQGADGQRRGARLAPAPPPWSAGLRARLGVSLRGAPSGGGLLVEAVDPGGPAEAIGIREGDLLVGVGPERGPSTPADEPRALWDTVGELPPGRLLGVTIRRAGRQYWGELKLR
ncbi:MAG: PDZ domain-containing protein [Planctomycetes bacterium]|nr:PDZ domain-containing protein [Planctomycetota bacterium]